MISIEDIEFLATFYKTINSNNKNRIDLNAFIEENGVSYSFQEDIIDSLKEAITDFSKTIDTLKKVDIDKNTNELVYDKVFVENTADLYTLFGELSIIFEDFQKLETKITKSLPEGPKDDSELR